MAVRDVAHGLVDFCRRGEFDAATEEFYSSDITSIEPHGDPLESHGIEEVRKKSEWWANTFDVHGVTVTGPYINGDQFTVRFEIDATNKASGERMMLDEIAVYSVRNDKVVYERFYNLSK